MKRSIRRRRAVLRERGYLVRAMQARRRRFPAIEAWMISDGRHFDAWLWDPSRGAFVRARRFW